VNDKYSNWLRERHPIWFVLLMLGMTYFVVLPNAVLSLTEVMPIGQGSKIMKMSDLHTRLFLGTLLVPFVETLIYQYLPVRVLRTWLKLPWKYVILISAILFGCAHTYSVGYVIFALVIGVVLAYAFALKDEPRQYGFLYVFVIHALRNTVSTFLMPFL
jgi:membrane protease YdiL (CAAX protease family)